MLVTFLYFEWSGVNWAGGLLEFAGRFVCCLLEFWLGGLIDRGPEEIGAV